MKIINREIFNTRKPMNDYFENIPSSSQDNYLKLYSIYSDLLIQYLIKKYNLKVYDDMIKNSKKNFTKVSEQDMDLYQYISSEYLDYLYIRNNIYLENLSEVQLEYLNKINDSKLTSEYEQFIENTYKDVIFTNDGYTMYGPDSSRYLKKSNSIIIGLRCKQVNLDNDSLKEFMDQENYLKLFIPELERQLNSRNIDEVNIIHYNDYSVITKDLNDKSVIKK